MDEVFKPVWKKKSLLSKVLDQKTDFQKRAVANREKNNCIVL